jgi:hypothetical protein
MVCDVLVCSIAAWQPGLTSSQLLMQYVRNMIAPGPTAFGFAKHISIICERSIRMCMSASKLMSCAHCAVVLRCILQAHPRRVAKVSSQIQREISEMFIYDKVRSYHV